MRTWPVRLSGAVVLVAAGWYLPWLVAHVDLGSAWLSVPFVAANLLLLVSLVVTIIDNWERAAPPDMLTRPGTEPLVGVLVPTAGEDTSHVQRTVRSVLRQQWPQERLWILVSDDAHSDDVRSMVRDLTVAFPAARIEYRRPPLRGDPRRRGDAKAGNLNSALEYIRGDEMAPEFIETRDADDEVGDAWFLSRCVAQLRTDPRAAFVQTVKEARVSRGDPFDNLQPHFFRGAMYARHAANAVFPCGSGLLWRDTALRDIGDFPTWNLVEDLQSGVEALRRGWRGIYLPIVGAFGQHAPEDIPNAYKQRGTWALDTMRLLIWGDLSGLRLRQRLQFYEMGLFYLQGFATLVFIASPVLGLAFGVYPIRAGIASYLLHFWPFATAMELFLATLNRPHSYEALWRARQIWVGFAFVYARACVLALLGGRHRKPVYRVTRKTHQFAWYWRETSPQVLLLLALVAAAAHAVTSSSPLLLHLDLGSAYWAVLYGLLLAGFVRKGWFGVSASGSRVTLRRGLARLRAAAGRVPGMAPAVAAAVFAGVAIGSGGCDPFGCGRGAPAAAISVLAALGAVSGLCGARVQMSSARTTAVALHVLSLAAFASAFTVLVTLR